MTRHPSVCALALPVALLLLAAAALPLGGCGEEFEPYNELSGFRVLGVEADSPWAASGESVQLDALLHTPSPSEVTTWWSWCPLPYEGSDTIECGVTYDAYQRLVSEVDPDFVAPAYMLGAAASTELPYPVPPGAVTEVCEALLALERPTLLEEPDCAHGLTVVAVLSAEHEGEVITTFKRVFLPAEDTPQRNPTLSGLSARRGDDAAVVLDDARSTRLKAGAEYTLLAEIPTDAAESYVGYTEIDAGEVKTETLSLTWFVEGGETDFIRTSYIAEEGALEEAGVNTWTTPDAPGEQLWLHVVVRDDRGGTGWLSRRVTLE